jgi:hypothetical protein
VHPAETLIHWSCSDKEHKQLLKEYKQFYDVIVNNGFKKELDVLISASYRVGSMDEWDANEEII